MPIFCVSSNYFFFKLFLSCLLIFRIGSADEISSQSNIAPTETTPAAVIPSHDSLIGDLLSMDLNAPAPTAAPVPSMPSMPTMPSMPPMPITSAAPTASLDLLGGGLDSLVCLAHFSIMVLTVVSRFKITHYSYSSYRVTLLVYLQLLLQFQWLLMPVCWVMFLALT